MVTGGEASGPACLAEPRPWSLEQGSTEGARHEDGVGFQPASETSIELPDRLPLPGTLLLQTEVHIVPLRNGVYALRGATHDDLRRQTAQSLLELGFEVQELTEPGSGPVSGRWKLLLGRPDGVHPSTPGRLVATGGIRIAPTCEGLFDLDANEAVHIASDVRWHGSVIRAQSVSVGENSILEGNIDCQGVVRLADGATVLGRVRCERIVMSRGARVGGGLVAGRRGDHRIHQTSQTTQSSSQATSQPPGSLPTPIHREHGAREARAPRLKPAPWVAPDETTPSAAKQEEQVSAAQGAAASGDEWTERTYVEAGLKAAQTSDETPKPDEAPKPTSDQPLELVLGVDRQESREFLDALGIRRLEGQQVQLDLNLELDRHGLVLRRRASVDDEYWERRITSEGHPILQSLRELLMRLGPDAQARAQVRDAGAKLHLGPVDPARLPSAMRELSDLVTNRTLSSVQAVTERKA